MKERLKILIVNDDGIAASGLRHLAKAALAFGEVYVAAPAEQCSGMSQKITIFDPIPVQRVAYELPVSGAWRIGGTPADCVKAAIHALLPEKPDFVLSGINSGYNAGFDTVYSGTVGAAMEGLMKGVPAIAVSQDFGEDYTLSDALLPDLLRELLDSPLPRDEMWNVNFPACAPGECRGILRDTTLAPLQVFPDLYDIQGEADSFCMKNISTPLLRADAAPEGSDVWALLNGWVSVGRLRCRVL